MFDIFVKTNSGKSVCTLTLDGVSDKLVYDLKRMIEETVDEKLTRKLEIDEAYASMEPARQMLSFNGH